MSMYPIEMLASPKSSTLNVLVIEIRVSCKRSNKVREWGCREQDSLWYIAGYSISLPYRVDERLKCDDPDQPRSSRAIS
jgi:hypothetical protein